VIPFFNKGIVDLESARVVYFEEIEVRWKVGGDSGEVV
jgi:hypothetical protein